MIISAEYKPWLLTGHSAYVYLENIIVWDNWVVACNGHVLVMLPAEIKKDEHRSMIRPDVYRKAWKGNKDAFLFLDVVKLRISKKEADPLLDGIFPEMKRIIVEAKNTREQFKRINVNPFFLAAMADAMGLKKQKENAGLVIYSTQERRGLYITVEPSAPAVNGQHPFGLFSPRKLDPHAWNEEEARKNEEKRKYGTALPR